MSSFRNILSGRLFQSGLSLQYISESAERVLSRAAERVPVDGVGSVKKAGKCVGHGRGELGGKVDCGLKEKRKRVERREFDFKGLR